MPPPLFLLLVRLVRPFTLSFARAVRVRVCALSVRGWDGSAWDGGGGGGGGGGRRRKEEFLDFGSLQ